MIPKPFSRVFIRAGDFIFVPKDLDEKSFEDVRLDIERRMIEGYAEADASWKRAIARFQSRQSTADSIQSKKGYSLQSTVAAKKKW